MVELQILNKILADKSLAFIKTNGIEANHFVTHRKQFEYIMNHYSQYGNTPDVPTFLMKFSDFTLLEVNESERYLIDTLHEQFMYSQIVPVVNQIAELLKTNSNDAVNFAKAEIERLGGLKIGYKEGYNLVANGDERYNEYEFRTQKKGLLGISTGIKELDEITHGWMAEDLTVIVGRTNEGKSWVLLYFLVQAWKQGKKVLLYSGQMSATTVGFRFDTLAQHFSNEALMSGLENIGNDLQDLTIEDYKQYVQDLRNNTTPFIIVTPKDLGGQRLDIPKLHTLIETYKPDIVGIDQLSLMADYRTTRNEMERMKFTHIAEDLYLTSEKYGIPIITPSQANREAVKARTKETKDEAPELHQIAESDGVAQNATRVIGIKQLGNIMKLSVRKNRYGKNNQEVMTIWDIDKGIVKPFLQFDGHTGDAEMTEEQSGVDLF